MSSDPPTIHLVLATHAQQSLLANLLQLYIHDFSEYIPADLGPDGRFEYPQLPLYWLEPSRFPFLVTVNGHLAGLVLIRQIQPPEAEEAVWEMAEFFVLRSYRRRGIGTRLSQLAFNRFPGSWQVRVMDSNAPAVCFWRRAVESFTGASQSPAPFTIEDARWWIFRFESRP